MDTLLILTSVGVCILLALSAILSMSETAIVAASRARIHNLAKDHDKNATIIVFLQKNLGHAISSLLMFNSITNISATTLATGVLVRFFGESGVIYATILMSGLIIFYCEVLPKILAIHYPERMSILFAKFLKLVFIVCEPATKFLHFWAKKNLKAFGVDLFASDESSSIEEIRGLIDMQAGPEDVIWHERSMLRGILDLATVDIDEIMTHRKEVVMFDISQGPEKIVQAVLQSPFTRIPLWETQPDNIIGILHTKELFKALHAHHGDVSRIDLQDIVARPWFAPDSTSLRDQLQAFRQRREHFACVVDEYGAFIGVVTLEDVLEEIVGEIVDEHDIDIPGVRVAQDGSILISGGVTIRDLNRQFGWQLSDEQAVTIAGLLIHEVRAIPAVGQTYAVDNLIIRVLRKKKNQITLLRVRITDNKRARADDA